MYRAAEILDAVRFTGGREELLRSPRNGEFAHRREVELARDKAGRTAARGLRRRVLAGTGEFLISCGRKLTGWAGADLPAPFRA